MDQSSLFDPEAGERQRDAAISRVAANADPIWASDAYQAIVWCAANHREFTANEVWARLSAVSSATTHEPRALGAAMRKAASRGVIVRTNRVVNSALPHQHRRPIPIWRSLTWRSLA